MNERYRNVSITYPDDVAASEIRSTVDEIIDEWTKNNKKLGSIEVTVENEEFVFNSKEKSPIVRTRRITGYLSNLNNFGDHKKAEEHDRVTHV